MTDYTSHADARFPCVYQLQTSCQILKTRKRFLAVSFQFVTVFPIDWKDFFASSMLCLVLSLCLISPLTIKVMDVWKSLATIRHCGQEQEEDREVRVWQDDTTDRDLRQALEEDLERADHHCCKTAKTASVYCRLAMLFKSLVFVTLLCSSS